MPTAAYIIRENSDISPNTTRTRSKFKKPISPQLMAPIITSVSRI